MLSPRRDHRLDNKTRIENIQHDISKIKEELSHLHVNENEILLLHERVVGVERELKRIMLKNDSNSQEALTILYANMGILKQEIKRLNKGKEVIKEDVNPGPTKSFVNPQFCNNKHVLFKANKLRIICMATDEFIKQDAEQLDSAELKMLQSDTPFSYPQQTLIKLCEEWVRFIAFDDYWYIQNKKNWINSSKTVGAEIKSLRAVIDKYKQHRWTNKFVTSAYLLADLRECAVNCLERRSRLGSVNFKSMEYVTKSTFSFLNLLKSSVVAYYLEDEKTLCVNERVADKAIIDLYSFIEKRKNIQNKAAYFHAEIYEQYMDNKFEDKKFSC